MATKIITYVLVVLVLTALVAAILANSMTKPLSHDEQMYCTGAVCLAQGRMIYSDFSYVGQMPYHPLLCAVLFKMFNVTHYLLVCRILSAVCDILVVVCIISIYRRVLESFPVAGLFLGLIGTVLFLFNPLVDYANGFAWNHDVVILCVVLSFWLFISTDFKKKSKYWRIALIGALLTFATCMRITTALVQLLFFAILLTRSAEPLKQRFKTALPFLIASAVVSIWPVWTMALAPRAFFLNLFWMPMLNGEWQRQIAMSPGRFDMIFSSLTTPGYSLLIVMAVYLCVILAWHHRKLSIPNKANALLAALLPLVFFIIAFIPLTMFKQYLAVPVPFLVISLAFPLSYLRRLTRRTNFNIASALAASCLIVAVASLPVVLRRIPKLFNPESWTPIRLHRISEDIAEKLKSQDSKLILTLAPLYALEGGCRVYPQLSAGPFAYRIADFMTPAELRTTNTVGPKTLAELVEKSPPSAVIIGVEPAFLEEPLLRAAIRPERQRWERKIYDDGPIVYFRR